MIYDLKAGRLPRPAAAGLGRPIVRNKPNSAGRPGPRRAKCAKRTQFPVRPGGAGPEGRGTRVQLCETNPIRHPGQARGVPAGAYRAKQTQFGADGQGRPSSRPEALAMPPQRKAMASNKPNSRRRCPGQGRRGVGRGRIVQNKPNSGPYADPEISVPGRAKRAKQSQLHSGTP